MADDWYSDHANAQLAEIKRKEAAGDRKARAGESEEGTADVA